MSRRTDTREPDLWVSHTELPKGPGHPFYRRLNALLREHGFDAFVEKACEPYYADTMGRPSIAPGVYFRMLFVGFFEAIGSERGICWRVNDSLSLREFIGLGLTDRCPDHSSLSRIRHRLDTEVMELVFSWMLKVLAENRVLKGKTLGIDATTLEANAAMRSIVRRNGGQTHREYIRQLAEQECEDEGAEPPDDRDARRRDKKRGKSTRNQDWVSPQDPEAGITRMKNGTTRVAHKVEHGIDMDSGAVVAVTVQAGQTGDSESIQGTLREGIVQMAATTGKHPEDLVADAGYDNEQTRFLTELHDLKPYVALRQMKRSWTGKGTEETRYKRNQRLNGNPRGKRLQRARGEKVERPFQLLYDRGRLRRLPLRGQENIRKRLLLQAAAYNLSLLLRKRIGSGTPKVFGELSGVFWMPIWAESGSYGVLRSLRRPVVAILENFFSLPWMRLGNVFSPFRIKNPTFSTAC
jgi:transposase